MGWCVLMLCWLAHVGPTAAGIQPGAAFGHAVRALLHPVLQGIMLACVLAAAMSTGDALQVTIAGLISQNIYKPYIRPDASEAQCVRVTRWAGVGILAASLGFAILMRANFVKAILQYMNIMGAMGIAVVLGILWRRMNTSGVFAATLVGALLIIGTRYVIDWPAASLQRDGTIAVTTVQPDELDALREQGKRVVTHTTTAKNESGEETGTVTHELIEWTPDAGLLRTLAGAGFIAWKGKTLESSKLTFTLLSKIALPLLAGILAGILVSLVTPRPRQDVLDKFFTKIYVPIGEEAKLALPLDQAVPPAKRWCTRGGLFLVKPTRQSWLGFLILWAICIALVFIMAGLLVV